MEKGNKPKVAKEKVVKEKKPKVAKEKKPKKPRAAKRPRKSKKMIMPDSKPLGLEGMVDYKQPSRQMLGGGGFTGQIVTPPPAPVVKPKRKYVRKVQPAPAQATASVPATKTALSQAQTEMVKEIVKRSRGRPLGSKNKPKEQNITKVSEVMYTTEPKNPVEKIIVKLDEEKQSIPMSKAELSNIIQPDRQVDEMKVKVVKEKKTKKTSKVGSSSNNTYLSDEVNYDDIEEGEPFNQAGFLNSAETVEGGFINRKRPMSTMKIVVRNPSSAQSFIGFEDQNQVISNANDSLNSLIDESVKDGKDMTQVYETELEPNVTPTEISGQLYPFFDVASTAETSGGESLASPSGEWTKVVKKRGRKKKEINE